MKVYNTSLILLILFIFLFFSCSQEETCRENKQVLLRVGFYTSGTSNTLNIDSVTVFGLNKDSIYKNVKNISKIALPLNNSAKESIFVLNTNGINDTINIQYSNKEYFISFACGTVITHKIDTVFSTKYNIKGNKIVNRDINTTDVQHIQILL
jgi:hypothetical protein